MEEKLKEIKNSVKEMTIGPFEEKNDVVMMHTVDVEWLIQKVVHYEAVLNTLLAKNDWINSEEVDQYIRDNLAYKR